ncbi:MAG: hypothetical protein SGARI_006749, partial [Bacillariaceae sp.]
MVICTFTPPFILVALLLLGIAIADNEVAVLENLKHAYGDWSPRGIIDVGANVGGWSRAARKVYPDAKILMFDAFSGNSEELQKAQNEIGNSVHRIAVLSNKVDDVVKFFVSDLGSTGNSMFLENTFYHKGKYVERNTSTLDLEVTRAGDLFSSSILYYVYLLFDVQGAELVVLEGAEKILEQVTFVQFEQSLVEYNQG